MGTILLGLLGLLLLPTAIQLAWHSAAALIQAAIALIVFVGKAFVWVATFPFQLTELFLKWRAAKRQKATK